jgi:hypothetical protein
MARIKFGWGNTDVFHYKPYIEQCCQNLEATQEFQSDLVLVYLVRLQHIIEEINQTFPNDEIETFKALGTPVALCIKALRTKLSSLRSRLPAELEHNPLFFLVCLSRQLCYTPPCSILANIIRHTILPNWPSMRWRFMMVQSLKLETRHLTFS